MEKNLRDHCIVKNYACRLQHAVGKNSVFRKEGILTHNLGLFKIANINCRNFEEIANVLKINKKIRLFICL